MQSHAIQFMANYGHLQPASPKITTRDETDRVWTVEDWAS